MKAIVKTAPGKGAELVANHPDPIVGDDEVLVEVMACSVCGSDRSFYNWGPVAQGFNMAFPRVLGHEASGVVAEVGRAVTTYRVGDRVALDSHAPCGKCYQCRIGNGHNCDHMRLLAADIDGVFAERVAVPASMAFPIPDSMSFDVATLLEPAGVGWHAIQRADKQIGGSLVVVSGCGPIGLLISEYAQLLGAAEVIGIEPNDFRRNLAKSRGATAFSCGEEALEYTNAKYAYRGGVDFVFEVSGAAKAYPTLLKILRRDSSLISIGHPGAPIEIDFPEVINRREITLKGIYGRLMWQTWEDLVMLLGAGKLDLSWMITDRLELSDLGPVIDMLSGSSNKVLMYPNGMPDSL